MPVVKANGIELAYEDHGSRESPAMLLIMGLGGQLTQWPSEYVDALVARGFRVIAFDNRDIGLSTHFDGQPAPTMAEVATALMAGLRPKLPFTLTDMAADAVGLLDALGIDKAHLVGVSMGGMIAQLVAVEAPERTLSLTSIMSSTGNPAMPQGKPEALAVLTGAPANDSEEALVDFGVLSVRAVESPAYPKDEQVLRERVRASVRRSSNPAGVARQIAAILGDGDRRQRLARLRVPTLVIHGADDPLVPAACGEDTARSINGAELKIIPGMGHDLPVELANEIGDAIAALARRATNEVSTA